MDNTGERFSVDFKITFWKRVKVDRWTILVQGDQAVR